MALPPPPQPSKPSGIVAGQRVALFLPTLEPGGAERAFVNLSCGMSELGMQVDLVVASAKGTHRRNVPVGVTLVDLRAPRIALALPGLVRYLRRARPFAVYAALEEANIVAMLAAGLARVGAKRFVSIRNTLSHEIARDGGAKLRAMNAMARQLYGDADGIIAVSQGVADDAIALLGLSPARVVVIANPIVTPDVAERAAEPPEHPWLRAGHPPVVLACGRLAAQKDHATLLRAFALLKRRMDARLVILGEGPEREELLTLAERCGIAGDVSLPGFDPNPFRYMARAAVFALSSVHEGSPGVLVQALACGCPIVSTDCPSGPREMLHGVRHARLVPVGDSAAMADALHELLAGDGARPRPVRLPGFDYRTSAAAYLALAGIHT